jgi:hypothetical protein
MSLINLINRKMLFSCENDVNYNTMNKNRLFTEPISPAFMKIFENSRKSLNSKKNLQEKDVFCKRCSLNFENIRKDRKAKTSVNSVESLPSVKFKTCQSSKTVFRSQSKKLTVPVLTSDENKEIKEDVNEKVFKELVKVKNRVIKQVKSMNDVGVFSLTGNLTRGLGLYTVQKGYL